MGGKADVNINPEVFTWARERAGYKVLAMCS